MASGNTFAARVKKARLQCGLSQAALAKSINHITKGKVSASLVSQWELGKVKNPQLETLSALVAITGFSHDWLATGKGPEKANLAEALAAQQRTVPLDRAAVARAVRIVWGAKPKTADAAAEVILALYDIIVESPGTDDAALRRMATLLSP